MEPSPYAPPKAVLEDIVQGPAPGRPPQVDRVVKMLWAALAINAVVSVIHLIAPPKALSLAYLIGAGIGGLLFSWWLYTRIGMGRNWARLLYLFLAIFSVLYLPFSVLSYNRGIVGLFDFIVGFVSAGIHLYVGYLLLTRPAREWYRQMKGR